MVRFHGWLQINFYQQLNIKLMTRQGKTWKRWTPEESNTILRCVNRNPGNVTKACREAAELLPDRTVETCKFHYYWLLKKNPHINNMAISGKSAIPNRRVVRDGCPVQPVKVKVSLLNKIKKLLFG